MKINKLYHLDFLENQIPDRSVNLIIADPPYFEVKGEFDFIWSSFEEYLKDVEKWAIECDRILSENGTLLWYGDSKKIAYTQIILDKYLNLNSSVCIHFLDRQTNKIPAKEARSFINVTERLLMYSKDSLNLTECVYHIRDYIRAEITKAKGKVILKHVNEALGTATNGGGVASACLSLDKSEPTMITKELYKKLQTWCNPHLNKPYEYLRKEYEELRKEYEEKRRPFNPVEKYKTDVLRFSQETHITGKYDHDTIKPEKLTRYLISTCSNRGDLVCAPFAGSGTECSLALLEKRNFIGFEISEKHYKNACKRIDAADLEAKQVDIFDAGA